MIIYGEVNLKHNDLEDTLKTNRIEFSKEVKESYSKVCEVMSKYEFFPRDDEPSANA